MAELTVASAIILCQRDDVRDALRQELKGVGIETADIHATRTAQECLSRIANMSTFFLVIDWEAGVDQVFEVLKATRGQNRTESIPILLIAAQVNENIFSVALEYQISRVHVGEISRSNVKKEIRELLRETKNLSPIKQLMIKVETMLRAADLDGAKKVLLLLREKAPDNPRVALELASLCIDRDEWDEAAAVLVMLEREDPPFARAKHLMARVLMKKGRTEAAIEALEGAQLINPYNVDRLMEMGGIFLDMGAPAEARDAFDHILEFAPEAKPAKMAKSQSLLQMGDINEALALLKDTASSRELASIFNTTAISAIKRGDHEKAMDLYKAAATALGNHPKVMARLMFNMGIGYVKWRKGDKSIECFQKAIELDPNFTDAKFNLSTMTTKRPKVVPAQAVGSAHPAETFNDLAGMDERLPGGGGPSLDLSFNTDFDDQFSDDDDTLE